MHPEDRWLWMVMDVCFYCCPWSASRNSNF